MQDKMKNMPGMDNVQNLLSQMSGMGAPGMAPGMNKPPPAKKQNKKATANVMQNQLEQNLRQSKQRERMLKKLEERNVCFA